MNKKLILGVVVGAVVVGSVVAMGTRAYFSQQGEVKSNTFSTGTLALKLDGAEEATAVWNVEAGAPGSEVSGTVNIKNAGNIVANHIEVTAANTVTEAVSGPGTVATTPLDTVLEITGLTYDFSGGDVRDLLVPEYITDKNANGIIDLDDLEKTLLDNLSLTDLDTEHEFAMTVRFNPVLTVAEHQGDSATTTLTVTLNQVAAQ